MHSLINSQPLDAYVVPELEAMIPNEYKKWAKPIVHYSIKTMCISIAFFLQRMISAVHSAVRGGVMVARWGGIETSLLMN